MKKTLFIIASIVLTNLCFAQTQAPLTIREVYNFAVGDTFQYFDYNLSLNKYARNYKQVTILNRVVDSLNQQFVYTQQIERFTPAYTADNRTIAANYTKTTELLRTRHLDSATYTKPLCPIISNPSPINYCFDSLSQSYGNRKTWRHEFNNNGFNTGKSHFAAGLGLTLEFGNSEQPNTERSDKMVFYNKSNQKWGERTDIFDIQKALCQPLTMREVYDFNEGDIFTYFHHLYRIPRGSDTLYERQTVLKKTAFLPDSIVYILKNESIYASALRQMTLKIDTFVVKNLDSSIVYKIKENLQQNVYAQDVCTTFYNTNIKVYGRKLYSDRLLDFGPTYRYGRGIGLTLFDASAIVPDLKYLIYFKKGAEIWGTPFSFPTSILPPSVSGAKIKCFPNPTHDVLNIDTNLSTFDIKISHLSGQIALESQNTTAINISNLPNGLYFLQVFEGSILRGVNKFVVQH